MRPLEIDQSTTLSHILNELKTTTEDGLEITSVPGEKTILDNPVNRSVIEKAAKEFKKEVALPASSEGGPTLTEGESTALEPDDLGFVEGEDVVACFRKETFKSKAAGVFQKQTSGWGCWRSFGFRPFWPWNSCFTQFPNNFNFIS